MNKTLTQFNKYLDSISSKQLYDELMELGLENYLEKENIFKRIIKKIKKFIRRA